MTTKKHLSCARMVAQVLQELVQSHQTRLKTRDSQSPTPSRNYHEFYNKNRPKMTVVSYVDRLAEYLHVSNSWFAVALIYIDRLTGANPNIFINECTIHRLLAVSLVLAMKYNDDQLLHNNAYVSQVVGIDTTELNRLEFLFMKMVDFKLFVYPNEFKQYWEYLVMGQLSLNDNFNLDAAVLSKAIKKFYSSLGKCSWDETKHTASNSPKFKPGKQRSLKRVKRPRFNTEKTEEVGKFAVHIYYSFNTNLNLKLTP